MPDAWTIAVQRAHRAAGLPSSRELAARAGVSHTTVCKLLRGKHRPSWRLTSRILSALDVDPNTLLELWLGDAEGVAGQARRRDVQDLQGTMVEDIRVIRGLAGRTMEDDIRMIRQLAERIALHLGC